MGIRRSITGTEVVRVGVKAAPNPTPVDVTTYPVELAFMVEGEKPADVDYHTGFWETIRGLTYACLLMGPDGAAQFTQTDEVYIPWVRVDLPGNEKPEFKGGPDHTIEVY